MSDTPQGQALVTVHLVLELPTSGPALAVQVDGAPPVLDETSGAASGSGWRLFEPVPGEIPPWSSLGRLDRGRYHREVRLPGRGTRRAGLSPAKWASAGPPNPERRGCRRSSTRSSAWFFPSVRCTR